jgi:hypothetical protein
MRFLTGLIDNGTRYPTSSSTAFCRAPSTSSTRTAGIDPADWGNWFSQLTAYASRQNLLVSDLIRSVMERSPTGT